MEIKIEDLKKITEELSSHLQDLNIETVELSEDYYWDIDRNQMYDPYQKPTDLTIGQLSDDWNDLGKLLHRDREPVGLDLVDLSTILRAIGYKIIG